MKKAVPFKAGLVGSQNYDDGSQAASIPEGVAKRTIQFEPR
jgi:hypothetical protein